MMVKPWLQSAGSKESSRKREGNSKIRENLSKDKKKKIQAVCKQISRGFV